MAQDEIFGDAISQADLAGIQDSGLRALAADVNDGLSLLRQAKDMNDDQRRLLIEAVSSRRGRAHINEQISEMQDTVSRLTYIKQTATGSDRRKAARAVRENTKALKQFKRAVKQAKHQRRR